MNHQDKIFLLGITVISTGTFFYMNNKRKSGKPLRLFGLDPSNSLKFVGAVSLISSGLVLFLQTKKLMTK